MLTTDLSLRMDPAYEKISRRFYENPDQFADAFARAWFKLTHRDMGPRVRYLGPLVPKETLIWQDPIPAADHPLIERCGHRRAEGEDPRLRPVGVPAGLDRLGVGVDVPRLRQARRRQRRAHPPRAPEGLGGQPAGAAHRRCLQKLEAIQKEFGKKVSLADLIVLGGCRRGREGREGCRRRREGPLHAGPHGRVAGADRRRSPSRRSSRVPTASATTSAAEAAVHGSPRRRWWTGPQLLRLTGPEMTVLVGGLRVLGANAGGSKHGVFTSKPGTLTNDFFVNLLDMSTEWQPAGADGVYEGRDRKTKAVKWTGTRVDLIFGSHSQLRAFAEVYACADSKEKFVKDFVAAWTKVMNADRFDLAASAQRPRNDTQVESGTAGRHPGRFSYPRLGCIVSPATRPAAAWRSRCSRNRRNGFRRSRRSERSESR